MRLYHGGTPGLRPGEVITPHEAKRIDGCPWCESGADDTHRPDRVFATTFRLYGRYYASKYVLGWLYRVEERDGMELSDGDPFETYHAGGFTVLSVLDRAVQLTPTERRRLLRLWKEADEARGMPKNVTADIELERMIGGRL